MKNKTKSIISPTHESFEASAVVEKKINSTIKNEFKFVIFGSIFFIVLPLHSCFSKVYLFHPEKIANFT